MTREFHIPPRSRIWVGEIENCFAIAVKLSHLRKASQRLCEQV